MVRVLSRLCDVNREAILEYFSKTFQGSRKGNARVVLSAQKPFTLSYSRKGSYVVIKCYYKFTNAYGYIFESEIDCCKTNRLTLHCSSFKFIV